MAIRTIFNATVCAAALSGHSAWAHHSFSHFDQARTVTLEGTVKEFQWTNPHAWLQLMAPNDKGQLVEWSLEFGSPNNLSRSGLKRNSFRPGDKVKVEMSPMRDGSFGGLFRTAIFADGTLYPARNGNRTNPQ